MFPDEEFLPKVPDPEDVIIEDAPDPDESVSEETHPETDKIPQDEQMTEWHEGWMFMHYIYMIHGFLST